MTDEVLSEEYRTASGERRRIRYVPKNNDGVYHRIEEKYDEDVWTEVGCETVREVIVETPTYTVLL